MQPAIQPISAYALERCLALLQDVKHVVAELRQDVKRAISHREKCCTVLSAAMAASLALEQALYSGNLDIAKEHVWQRICTKVMAAVDLGDTRIQVYGQQGRIRKYVKVALRSSTLQKFDEVVRKLNELEDQAWSLQEGPNPAVRFEAVTRRSVSSRSALMPGSRPATAGVQHADHSNRAILARARLRRGSRGQWVRSLLYIPPELSSPKAPLGQVWWYIGGLYKGRLYVHDLAENETVELPAGRSSAAVLVMHQDNNGLVWTGHKGGSVRVWSDASRNAVVSAIKVSRADIRAIATDESSQAWIGSDSGNVKSVVLKTDKHKRSGGSGSSMWLQPVATLRWAQPDATQSLSGRQSNSGGAAEPVASDAEVVQSSLGLERAHAGPVASIACHGDRVITSGGTPAAACLREWAADGRPLASVALGTLGVARSMTVLKPLVEVRLPDLDEAGAEPSTLPRSTPDAASRPAAAEVSPAGTSTLEQAPPGPGPSSSSTSAGGENPNTTRQATPQPGVAEGNWTPQYNPFAGPHDAPNTGQLADESDPPDKRSAGWQLLTAHESGQLQLWDASNGFLQPVIRIGQRQSPVRSSIVCERMGIICTAHANGNVLLRMLPHREAVVLLADQTQPCQSVDPPAAVIAAHRSGVVCASGGDGCILTASAFGSIMLWPEAELRSFAEADGFVLPARPSADLDDYKADPHAFMSRVLQRYFKPHTDEVTQAVLQRLGQQQAATRPRTSLSPVVSMALKESGSAMTHAASRELLNEVVNILNQSSSQNDYLSTHSVTPDASHPRTSQDSAASALVRGVSGSLSERQGSLPIAGPQAGGQLLSATGPNMSAPLLGLSIARTGSSGGVSPTVHRSIIDNEAEGAAGYRHMASHGLAAWNVRFASDNANSNTPLKDSLPHWSSGSFFAETASNWVIDFRDLVFKKMIGEGSIGRVHLGKWQETDVAIKVLNSLGHIGLATDQQSSPQPVLEKPTQEYNSGSDPESDSIVADANLTLRTLEREVGIMSAIRHPNVVLFMGVCLEPPCLVSEFCARGSLYDVLQKARNNPMLAVQLDWPRRLSMALDAAKGMLQLHSHKPHILHRDLKSPNLLVDKHWRCKVGDFNLSRVMEASAIVSSISANNPRWLAPEVVIRQAYSKAADVFSFGIILWELLTWQLPWEELGPFQIMVGITEKKLRPDIPPPERLPGGTFPGLPGYLSLMKRCWDEEPTQRPTFEEVITVLRPLLEEATASRTRRIGTPPQPGQRPPVPQQAPGAGQGGAAPAAGPSAQRSSSGRLAAGGSGNTDRFTIATSSAGASSERNSSELAANRMLEGCEPGPVTDVPAMSALYQPGRSAADRLPSPSRLAQTLLQQGPRQAGASETDSDSDADRRTSSAQLTDEDAAIELGEAADRMPSLGPSQASGGSGSSAYLSPFAQFSHAFGRAQPGEAGENGAAGDSNEPGVADLLARRASSKINSFVPGMPRRNSADPRPSRPRSYEPLSHDQPNAGTLSGLCLPITRRTLASADPVAFTSPFAAAARQGISRPSLEGLQGRGPGALAGRPALRSDTILPSSSSHFGPLNNGQQQRPGSADSAGSRPRPRAAAEAYPVGPSRLGSAPEHPRTRASFDGVLPASARGPLATSPLNANAGQLSPRPQKAVSPPAAAAGQVPPPDSAAPTGSAYVSPFSAIDQGEGHSALRLSSNELEDMISEIALDDNDIQGQQGAPLRGSTAPPEQQSQDERGRLLQKLDAYAMDKTDPQAQALNAKVEQLALVQEEAQPPPVAAHERHRSA